MIDTEKINLQEIITKESTIFVFCSNGNGRSKFIARALDELGYRNARATGAKKMHEIDSTTLTELAKAPVIICANTDVVSQISFYKNGELVKGKIVLDLKMSEPDHIIASGHMSKNKTLELKQRVTEQLKALGF